MKTQRRASWLPAVAVLLTACSAAGPASIYDDEDNNDPDAWEQEGAEGEGEDLGEAPADDTLGGGGSDPGTSGSSDPLPDTTVGTVCYPGPYGANDACVSLVNWSSSWGSAYSYPSHSSAQYRKPLRFVDLAAADPELLIAENFKLGEVMQEWKGRYAVFQPHVADKLQQLRDATGGALYINSAYRSPAYNASVDGATYSRHMYGDAVDVRSGAASLSQIRSVCQNLGAGYIGMYSTFVHCDWRNHPLDPKFFSSSPVSLPSLDDIDSSMPVHTAELVVLADGLTYTAPATGFDEGEPLRTWTAYDSAGEVIEIVDAPEYEPPADAIRLHVEVGGNVDLELEL